MHMTKSNERFRSNRNWEATNQVSRITARRTGSGRALLGSDASAYGIAVLDVSDPSRPRYAELNGNQAMNAGSVGKILVALAWFQALADLYPDVEARRSGSPRSRCC